MHTVFRVHACAHTCAPYVVAEGESSHAGYEDGNQSLSAGFVACRHVSRRTGNATTDRTFSVCGISTTKGNTLSRIDTVLSLTFHFWENDAWTLLASSSRRCQGNALWSGGRRTTRNRQVCQTKIHTKRVRTATAAFIRKMQHRVGWNLCRIGHFVPRKRY